MSATVTSSAVRISSRPQPAKQWIRMRDSGVTRIARLGCLSLCAGQHAIQESLDVRRTPCNLLRIAPMSIAYALVLCQPFTDSGTMPCGQSTALPCGWFCVGGRCLSPACIHSAPTVTAMGNTPGPQSRISLRIHQQVKTINRFRTSQGRHLTRFSCVV